MYESLRLVPQEDLPHAFVPASRIYDPATGARGEAFERFRHAYAFGADVEAAPGDFHATIHIRLIAGGIAFDRRLRGLEMARDPARVRRDALEHATVQIVRAGRMEVETAEHREVLGPGDAMVLDMTRSFRSRPEASLYTLSVPRERLLAVGVEPSRLHGRKLRNGGRLATLLAGGWDHDAEGLAEDFAVALSQLAGVRAAVGAPPPPSSRIERALAFLEAELGRSDLSPARIAAASGMSRATLYRALEPLGGVAGWVQGRRLQRLHALLEHTTLPVSEAGALAGFNNASHLSYAFQARFGHSPSGFRRLMRSEGRSWLLDPEAALRDVNSLLAASTLSDRAG